MDPNYWSAPKKWILKKIGTRKTENQQTFSTAVLAGRVALTPRGSSHPALLRLRRARLQGRQMPKRQAPGATHQTPDTRRQTPSARHQTPDTRRQTPDAWLQTPVTRWVPPDARRQCQTPMPDTSATHQRQVPTPQPPELELRGQLRGDSPFSGFCSGASRATLRQPEQYQSKH